MSDNQKLIDTNVLVYAYDRSEQQKYALSKSLVADIWQTGDGVVTLQNLTEFFVGITRKYEITSIVTENESDFKHIPGITVINPFK